MGKKITLSIYFFFCLGYFCAPVFADTVTLKSGQIVEGKIIENTDKFVKIDFNGVELTYFPEEIVSVNQGNTVNAVSKELTSLYETFKSGKKAVENNKLADELTGPAQSMVNQKAQEAAEAIVLPSVAENIDAAQTGQSVISQLPKEYQGMIKSKLHNMPGQGSAGPAPAADPADLSNLPPEYQKMIRSNLEKLQSDAQAAKK